MGGHRAARPRRRRVRAGAGRRRTSSRTPCGRRRGLRSATCGSAAGRWSRTASAPPSTPARPAAGSRPPPRASPMPEPPSVADPAWSALVAELCSAGRSLVAASLVLGSGGNLSARAPGGEVVAVTARGTWLDRLTPTDLSLVRLADGVVVGGAAAPSTELALHVECYRARPDVTAVVHVHPQLSVLLTALGHPIRLITTDHVAYVARGARRAVPASRHARARRPRPPPCWPTAVRLRGAVPPRLLGRGRLGRDGYAPGAQPGGGRPAHPRRAAARRHHRRWSARLSGAAAAARRG